MTRTPTIIATFSLIAVLLVAPLYHVSAKTVGFTPTISAADLQAKYVSAASGGDKVRILIVPGHEPDFGGAVYKGVYEREINVEIADQLAADLKKNPRLDVIVARSNTAWSDDLQNYFDDQMTKIKKFVTTQKKLMSRLVDHGTVTTPTADQQVDHATAPDDVALRLYGISKWANENDVDLVVHVHINDAPDHGDDTPSANSGYAVYIPDPQYGNGPASRPVGEAIANRLAFMNATSTLAGEHAGVVEDQQLIALGSFGTLNVPSVLIEYSYITESKFQQPEVRSIVTKDYAYETYLGLQDFFKDPVATKYRSASLPFTFTTVDTVGSTSPATYALQAKLRTLGFYPPQESSLVECPISGTMNECTQVALKAFQASKGWEQTGAIGPLTRGALNAP